MSARPDDVVDQLDRLAAYAPVVGVDPDAVWTRGHRRQRVRTGAVAAALVVVALLGTATTSTLVERAQRVGPADTDDRMVLPDVIRQPGAWEPSFPKAPGRLSAVGLGTRAGLLSDRNAWWGASLGTGETRFLDLPDATADADTDPALSPDGRLLAYWIAGDVPGESLRSMSGLEYDDVVGAAVMDLATGEVNRWEVEAANGLSVRGLAWAGDTLWWMAGDLRSVGDGGTSSRSLTRTWDLSTGEQETLGEDARGARLDLGDHGTAADGFVAAGAGSRLWRVASDGSVTATTLSPPGGSSAEAGLADTIVSPDGDRVAALLLADGSWDGTRRPLVAGRIAASGARLGRLPIVHRLTALVGWRSSTEVVAVEDRGLTDDGLRINRLFTVDVSNGSGHQLLELHGNVPRTFASEALGADIVSAPTAPFAPDPRLIGLGLLAAALVGWRIAVRVRRRRGHA